MHIPKKYHSILKFDKKHNGRTQIRECSEHTDDFHIQTKLRTTVQYKNSTRCGWISRKWQHSKGCWSSHRQNDHFPCCIRMWKSSFAWTIWAASWQNQQSECAPSEDSDQPGHPPSLIRVCAVRFNVEGQIICPLTNNLSFDMFFFPPVYSLFYIIQPRTDCIF